MNLLEVLCLSTQVGIKASGRLRLLEGCKRRQEAANVFACVEKTFDL